MGHEQIPDRAILNIRNHEQNIALIDADMFARIPIFVCVDCADETIFAPHLRAELLRIDQDLPERREIIPQRRPVIELWRLRALPASPLQAARFGIMIQDRFRFSCVAVIRLVLLSHGRADESVGYRAPGVG